MPDDNSPDKIQKQYDTDSKEYQALPLGDKYWAIMNDFTSGRYQAAYDKLSPLMGDKAVAADPRFARLFKKAKVVLNIE